MQVKGHRGREGKGREGKGREGKPPHPLRAGPLASSQGVMVVGQRSHLGQRAVLGPRGCGCRFELHIYPSVKCYRIQ
eukprot:scaffold310707_cov17-Prasinocladus_malaysianus.AAC.1